MLSNNNEKMYIHSIRKQGNYYREPKMNIRIFLANIGLRTVELK